MTFFLDRRSFFFLSRLKIVNSSTSEPNVFYKQLFFLNSKPNWRAIFIFLFHFLQPSTCFSEQECREHSYDTGANKGCKGQRLSYSWMLSYIGTGAVIGTVVAWLSYKLDPRSVGQIKQICVVISNDSVRVGVIESTSPVVAE